MATYDGGLLSGYILRFDVWQAGQNIGGNFSTVSWQLKIVRGIGSGKWAGGPHNWSLNVGGHGASGSFGSYDFRNYSELILSQGNVDRGHNADGGLTISSSASFDDNNSYGELGDGSASGSLQLTTIPRATTAVWAVGGNAVAGVAKVINLPRASASFTHTVDWYFGNQSGQIGTGLGTSVTWIPAMSMLTQIPSAVTGSGILRTTTYNGGTVIGTKDSGFSLDAPSSVVPTFTTVTASEATVGIAANIGGYVQGISKLALAITGAAGAYSSTISSYKIVVDAQTINAVSGTTPAALAFSGTVSIVGTITDSRGRTASKTVTVTVLPYAPPSIIALTAKRALVAGTLNDNGTYIRVDINATTRSLVVAAVEKNTLVYKISTRAYGTTIWTLKSTVTPGGVAFNSYALVSPYPIEQSFDVLVEVTDDFATSAQQLTVATASIFQHWDGALGIGIGKYRQNGMLDVLGQIFQNNGERVLGTGTLKGTAAQRDLVWNLPVSTLAERVILQNRGAKWLLIEANGFMADQQYFAEYNATTNIYGQVSGAGWYITKQHSSTTNKRTQLLIPKTNATLPTAVTTTGTGVITASTVFTLTYHQLVRIKVRLEWTVNGNAAGMDSIKIGNITGEILEEHRSSNNGINAPISAVLLTDVFLPAGSNTIVLCSQHESGGFARTLGTRSMDIWAI